MKPVIAVESQKKTISDGTPPDRRHQTAVSCSVRHFRAIHVFLLHSLTAWSSEIPRWFSSSSLPPEFTAGRCAATFIPAAAAR
jgi:hypothetical protein